jgi:hypothetical protein
MSFRRRIFAELAGTHTHLDSLAAEEGPSAIHRADGRLATASGFEKGRGTEHLPFFGTPATLRPSPAALLDAQQERTRSSTTFRKERRNYRRSFSIPQQETLGPDVVLSTSYTIRFSHLKYGAPYELGIVP